MAELEIIGASKKYGDALALDSVSLDIRDGELLALLGPSGCGKTTLLRLVAGFEHMDSGSIRIGGRLVSGKECHVETERRNVAVVFQSYALWPHMDVRGNVGYPLKVAGMSKAVRNQRVREALDTVGLTGLGGRRPADLSGGQRQRVALARCLVMQPEVVLLDEPLANLDVHLRDVMLQEFKDFHCKTRATMVFVTHDQSEAMAIADRIAVLEKGRLRQIAAPQDLFEKPATAGIARFIGHGCVADVTVVDVVQESLPCGNMGETRRFFAVLPGIRQGRHRLVFAPFDWRRTTESPVLWRAVSIWEEKP